MQKNPTQHKNDKKKSRSFSLFKPRDRQPNYILSVLCTTVALLLVVMLVMGMGGFGLVMGVAKAYYDTTPELDVEKIETQNLTSFIYDCNGDLITAYRGSENRIWANFDEIPDQLAKAFVAVEDARFYTHNGIDIKRIIGAFVSNLQNNSTQGGSTITQQYAERYYLGETPSYVGTLREAFLAVKIAQAQDKSQVLCNYMNTIYLGRGAYGIQAAAKAYFGKDAKDMTLSEAAMLAGIIPAPSVWTPDVNPKQAEKRYKRVLNIMDEDGYITPDEKKAAKFPQTIEIQQNNQMSGPNGYLLTMVQKVMSDRKERSDA